MKDRALNYVFCNYDSHKRHMRNVNGGCTLCGKGPTSIFDIQGSSRGRGSLTTALFNYKEVQKAAPISTVMVEEEGKVLMRATKVIPQGVYCLIISVLWYC